MQQGDLSLSEELRLSAAEGDGAYCDTFSHQGDAKDRAEAPAPRVFAGLWKFARLGLHVSNVDGSLIENRSARDCPTD